MENAKTNPTNKKQFPGTARFSKSDSTFKSIIYFASGKTLVGYSKGTIYKEPEDKIYMLEGWIIRLHGCGYWLREKVKEIHWFEYSLLSDEEVLVMITTPDQYHMGTAGRYCTSERLIKFLHRFYECHRKGKVSNEIRDKAFRVGEKDFFDLSQKRFKNGEELLKHCLYVTSKGWPHGQIQNFYIKYTEKYLSAA